MYRTIWQAADPRVSPRTADLQTLKPSKVQQQCSTVTLDITLH